MHILEAIFSFLFGDGNPNEDLEHRRMKAVTSLIRHNKGVVIAEQVQPYLDTCLLESKAPQRDGYFTHQGYMVSIVRWFEGRIESSNEGQLVYVFPHIKKWVGEEDVDDGTIGKDT